MNFYRKYLNTESRRKLYNYLRPSQYNLHPELKATNIPNERWRMLLTMRDLRLWMEENAPFSSRSRALKQEVFYINEDLNYLQMRSFILPFLLFAAVNIWFLYWAPKHWKGHVGIINKPVHQQVTGGFSVLHDGAVPRMTTMDLTEVLGI